MEKKKRKHKLDIVKCKSGKSKDCLEEFYATATMEHICTKCKKLIK